MAIGVDQGYDAGANGETGSLDSGERNMAWVVGRRAIEDREVAGRCAGNAGLLCAGADGGHSPRSPQLYCRRFHWRSGRCVGWAVIVVWK